MTPAARRPLLAAIGVVIAAAAPSALSIVIRHDRGEAASLERAKPFDAAGRILPDGGCALVAPGWAVTAAHVAASLPGGARVEFGGRAYQVRRVILHPEGRAPRGVPPEVDLALLELADPVAGIAPLPLYRGRAELGKTLVLVGYGDFGSPNAPLARSDGRRRAATNVVADAGPRRLFLRFDAPPRGTDLEGIGGPGDSGGPALLEENGRAYLAGVSSASAEGKPGHYGVTDIYTRVSSYADWIDKTIAER